MSADSPGLVQGSGAGAGVHGDGLADDEAIADEFADGLAGVGVGDLVDLVGVEPDLALAAADDGSGQALLGSEIDPVGRFVSASDLLQRRTRRGRHESEGRPAACIWNGKGKCEVDSHELTVYVCTHILLNSQRNRWSGCQWAKRSIRPGCGGCEESQEKICGRPALVSWQVVT